LLLAAALSFVVVALVPWPAAIGGDGQVLPASEIAIRAGTTGIVRGCRGPRRRARGRRAAPRDDRAARPDRPGRRPAADAERAQARGASAGEASDAYAQPLADLDAEKRPRPLPPPRASRRAPS
jgi:hypothetical protein